MTTGQIAEYANLDGIKGGVTSANVQFVIRWKLVYQFLHDIGYPAWARRYTSATLTAGNNYFDITATDDFRQMGTIVVAPDYDTPLEYIGDQEAKLFAAQAATTAGSPTQYWLGFDGTHYRRVFVNCPADQTYTLPLSYYKLIPFANDTDTGVELNQYIPRDVQWPLVELLKKHFYAERYGIEDNRTQLAKSEYDEWIMRIRENPEKSRGSKYSYMT